MVKVIFLGTNGWYDTDTGNTNCVLIDSEESYVILDAGNGLYKIDRYIKGKKPIYLFLSHFHLDHICGMHILNKFKFKQGITICCYQGGEDSLNNIIKQPYTVAFKDLPFKVEIKEMKEGTNNEFPFKLKAAEFVHSSKCFGYRFEFADKVIAYCSDTGYCEAMIELSRNVDLLISECSLKSGQTSVEWPHLNPEDAANTAKESVVKKLVLMHFDADNYTTLNERRESEEIARKIFENTFFAKDGKIMEI